MENTMEVETKSFPLNEESAKQKDSQSTTSIKPEIQKQIVKKKYKKRRFPELPQYGKYILTPIYKNTITNSDEVYYSGEILVDFGKLHNPCDMYSPWNHFKNVNCSLIDFSNRLLVTKLDDKSYSLFNQEMLIQKYKNYPNSDVKDLCQLLQDLTALLEKYKKTQQIISMINPHFQFKFYHHFITHDGFQKRMYQHYNALGKNCRFLSRHFGPDLIKNKLQFYQQVCSESLIELLGQSIEESQSQQHRLGIYDFFEFETIFCMQRNLMKSILNRFSNESVIPEEYIEYIQPLNLKFVTYDEISFYADITIQTLSQKQFNQELGVYSLYFSIIFILNVSPSMEESIKLQRQKLRDMGIKSNNAEDITYTIQAEIFKDKFMCSQSEANGGVYNDQNRNKVCGYRNI